MLWRLGTGQHGSCMIVGSPVISSVWGSGGRSLPCYVSCSGMSCENLSKRSVSIDLQTYPNLADATKGWDGWVAANLPSTE